MTAIVLVTLFGAVLMLLGAAVGAEIQDRLSEDRRRRTAHRQRQVNARWRALQNQGGAYDLTPFMNNPLVIPVAVGVDDFD